MEWNNETKPQKNKKTQPQNECHTIDLVSWLVSKIKYSKYIFFSPTL